MNNFTVTRDKKLFNNNIHIMNLDMRREVFEYLNKIPATNFTGLYYYQPIIFTTEDDYTVNFYTKFFILTFRKDGEVCRFGNYDIAFFDDYVFIDGVPTLIEFASGIETTPGPYSKFVVESKTPLYKEIQELLGDKINLYSSCIRDGYRYVANIIMTLESIKEYTLKLVDLYPDSGIRDIVSNKIELHTTDDLCNENSISIIEKDTPVFVPPGEVLKHTQRFIYDNVEDTVTILGKKNIVSSSIFIKGMVEYKEKYYTIFHDERKMYIKCPPGFNAGFLLKITVLNNLTDPPIEFIRVRKIFFEKSEPKNSVSFEEYFPNECLDYIIKQSNDCARLPSDFITGDTNVTCYNGVFYLKICNDFDLWLSEKGVYYY